MLILNYYYLKMRELKPGHSVTLDLDEIIWDKIREYHKLLVMHYRNI